jgi:Zn-dependent peptidase ImmA (M78 family)
MSTPQELVEDQEATYFAMCLLMPRHWVVMKAQEIDITTEIGVSTMARLFGVSDQWMLIRLQQLQLIEIIPLPK